MIFDDDDLYQIFDEIKAIGIKDLIHEGIAKNMVSDADEAIYFLRGVVKKFETMEEYEICQELTLMLKEYLKGG